MNAVLTLRPLTRHAFAALLAAGALLHDSRAAAQGVAESAALQRTDFAYAIALETTPGLAVQTLLVPTAVYRTALRPDLGDVRIFNAAGALLPHALRTLEPPSPVDLPLAERERSVAIFPLTAAPGAATPALESLSLHIERGPGGSVIDIHTRGASDPAPKSSPDAGTPAERVLAYILDTQAIDREMLSLRLELATADDAPSYLRTVIIEASDDLATFREVARDGVLAQLTREHERVLRDRIELSGVRAKFLRIRTRDEDLPAPIVRAFVEVAQGEAPLRARESLRVPGMEKAGEPGVYDFDLGGSFPAERMRVLLPSVNTLVQVELSAANVPGDHPLPQETSAIRARTSKRIYDDVYNGALYRLVQEGQEVSSPPIELDARRIRYVHLIVAEDTKLDMAPELEIEYSPAQLIFIARDPAPFELAYGSHVAMPSKVSADATLAPLSESARKLLPPSTVKLGAMAAISGAAALTPPPTAPPIKTYVLWAILIVGTLGITALAVRLLRKLD